MFLRIGLGGIALARNIAEEPRSRLPAAPRPEPPVPARQRFNKRRYYCQGKAR